MTKRIKVLTGIIMLLLIVLLCRLYYIQIVCHEELERGARGQQIIQIQRQSDRGTIYDRNMVKLTDSCSDYYYLLKRENCTVALEKLMKRIEGETAGTKGEKYVVYRSAVFNKEVNDILVSQYGAYAFCSGSRYADEQTAVHLIGYLNNSDGTGVAGLEKMFESRLDVSSSILSMTGNGLGDPVRGIGISRTSDVQKLDPSALVTTVDAGLQAQVEKILREEQVSGAAVVLQAKTGQVLAMASTPVFNPNDVDSYLGSDGGELINKAVQGQYPPGSVFKIAVAAAVLESGIVSPEDTFICDGSTTVNGVELICEEKPEGHGELNLEEALAQSCNCYFAQMGAKIGSETIIEMAERMGLGSAAIEGFPDEAEGNFPSRSERLYSGLSNLSIGQGSLLVTPVQIARMTNVIANGGIDRQVSVVMSRENEESEGSRVMTAATAGEVGNMMEKVMTEGTASSSRLHVQAAGKTGSAETVDGGEETVHGWFTGYFPADDPEYTVAVIAENGKTGSSSALPVFEEIVNYLY